MQNSLMYKRISKNKSGGRKKHLLLILAGILILISEASGVFSWALVLRNFIHSQGTVGYLFFVIIYALTSLLLIPGTGMTLLSGLLFDPLTAITLSMTGAMIASTGAFWIARKAAREKVQQWLSRQKKYERYIGYVNEHQTRVLIILRIIPVFPHVVMNYVFGLTRISFLSYCFWTWFCLLPGTSMYVMIAHSVGTNLMAGHVVVALTVSFLVISVMIYLAW